MNKDLFLSKASETNCFISESKILSQLAGLGKAVIISMDHLEYFSLYFLTIKEEIANQGLTLLGVVPQDELVYEYDCEGRPTVELPEDSPVRKAMSEIVKKLNL